MSYNVKFATTNSGLLMTSSFNLNLLAHPKKGPMVNVLTPCCGSYWLSESWIDSDGIQRSRLTCKHGATATENPILYLPTLEEGLLPWLALLDPLEAPLVAASVAHRLTDLIIYSRTGSRPLEPLIPSLHEMETKREALELYSGDLFTY